jgi:zinc protease
MSMNPKRNLLVLTALGLAACAPHQTVPMAAPVQDRSVVPQPGPTPDYDFPDIQRHTLSNGLEVWLVERPGLPMSTLRLVVDAGQIVEPRERVGVASLTAAMLDKGTSTRDVLQIADEIDFLAASLSAGASEDAAFVTLSTLERNLGAALEVFGDVVRNPAFPAEEWQRVQRERLTAIMQAADQPTTRANQEFARRLYGEAHPYGRPVVGTASSVQAITTEELRRFYELHYHPANANLIVVGPTPAARLLPMLEQALGGWRAGERAAFQAPASPAPQAATRIYLVDQPGAAQSEIRIGHVGVMRSHRDYFPLLVLNTILGGQFSSRINLNLREDKGYTYGARSAWGMGRLEGPFTASAGVQTEVTRESVIEFMREIEDIRGARPVTEQELEFARNAIMRREPLTLETNAQIAGRMQDLILYDLPLDYFDHFNRQVAAVTLADLSRVAREYLHPQRFAIVVVGDQAVVEEALRDLPYPLEIVRPDDPTAPPPGE